MRVVTYGERTLLSTLVLLFFAAVGLGVTFAGYFRLASDGLYGTEQLVARLEPVCTMCTVTHRSDCDEPSDTCASGACQLVEVRAQVVCKVGTSTPVHGAPIYEGTLAQPPAPGKECAAALGDKVECLVDPEALDECDGDCVFYTPARAAKLVDDVKHVGVIVLSVIGSFGGLLVLMGLAVAGTVRAKPGFPWCCTFRRGLVTVQVNKGGVLHHRHDLKTCYEAPANAAPWLRDDNVATANTRLHDPELDHSVRDDSLDWLRDLPSPANGPVVRALLAYLQQHPDPPPAWGNANGAAGDLEVTGGSADASASASEERVVWKLSNEQLHASQFAGRRSVCTIGRALGGLIGVFPIALLVIMCLAFDACDKLGVYMGAGTVITVGWPLGVAVQSLMHDISATSRDPTPSHVVRVHAVTTRRIITVSMRFDSPLLPDWKWLRSVRAWVRGGDAPTFVKVVEHSYGALADEWERSTSYFRVDPRRGRTVPPPTPCCCESICDGPHREPDYDLPDPFAAEPNPFAAPAPTANTGGTGGDTGASAGAGAPSTSGAAGDDVKDKAGGGGKKAVAGRAPHLTFPPHPALEHVRVNRAKGDVEFARVQVSYSEDAPYVFSTYGMRGLALPDAMEAADAIRRCLRDE